jgi:hypothetical protein
MDRKVGGGTAAVSREALRTARGTTNGLSSEEEKVVRMRHGMGAAKATEPLARAAAGNAELEDELLLIEMRLLRAMRLRSAQPAAGRNLIPQPSRTKDKIVRSLRRKK